MPFRNAYHAHSMTAMLACFRCQHTFFVCQYAFSGCQHPFFGCRMPAAVAISPAEGETTSQKKLAVIRQLLAISQKSCHCKAPASIKVSLVGSVLCCRGNLPLKQGDCLVVYPSQAQDKPRSNILKLSGL